MEKVDYFAIIQKHFTQGSRAEMIYIAHVTLVTQFALELAQNLNLSSESLRFIEEASMLHDIGTSKVYAPDIDCYGDAQYIEHGYIGRELLESEGLFAHALTCERHTGSGLSALEIIEQELPLPNRDMLPLSVEEKIICYADLFYSKKPHSLFLKKHSSDVRNSLRRFPGNALQRFTLLEKDVLRK